MNIVFFACSAPLRENNTLYHAFRRFSGHKTNRQQMSKQVLTTALDPGYKANLFLAPLSCSLAPAIKGD
jgi:hypothetical protein